MLRPMTAVLAACTVLTGCATSVDGVARDEDAGGADPAAPTVVRALDQLLPTSQELSDTLGIAPTGFMGQLVAGGPDTLLAGVDRSEASPADCVSATYRLQQMTYAASPVRSVATQSWAGGSMSGPALSGFFGVVQFATADDARAFFAAAADKWRQCDGATMVLHQTDSGTREQSLITDVTIDPQVISAVVLHDAGQGADGMTVQRALGVAADCIVDVEIADLADATGDGARGAADVVGLIQAKISR